MSVWGWFAVGLVIGLFVGGSLGVLLMGILNATRWVDDWYK